MRILTLPGVYAPDSDTRLLCEILRAQTLAPEADVLDLCTGSGAVAICAAASGPRSVTAVDVSRRAVLIARINARRNGVSVTAVRGDLLEPVPGRSFDAILANPPYVPADGDVLPTRGRERAWDAGRDGRALLDRICGEAPSRLNPGGFLLLVHSSLCGVRATQDALEAAGLDADVVVRRREAFGPVLAARAEALEERGLLTKGRRHEQLVVVRGRRPPTVRRRTIPAAAAVAVAVA